MAPPPAASRRLACPTAVSPRHLRRPRLPRAGRQSPPGTARLRRDEPPPDTRGLGPAHAARTPDRPPGGHRAVQPRNRAAAVHLAPDRRLPPPPDLPQAPDHLPQPAQHGLAWPGLTLAFHQDAGLTGAPTVKVPLNWDDKSAEALINASSRSTSKVNLTGWSKGLEVIGDGEGIVSHAGLTVLRLLADKTGLTELDRRAVMPVPGNRRPGSRPSPSWQMPGVRWPATSCTRCGPLSGEIGVCRCARVCPRRIDRAGPQAPGLSDAAGAGSCQR